jgi:hypothetical protein
LATDFWGAADKAGHPTNDPKDVLGGGGLLYLGGEEETGGYKGYGLALMVELFTGILSGADYGANIPPWRQGRGRYAHFSHHQSKAHHHLCADRTHARTHAHTHTRAGRPIWASASWRSTRRSSAADSPSEWATSCSRCGPSRLSTLTFPSSYPEVPWPFLLAADDTSDVHTHHRTRTR